MQLRERNGKVELFEKAGDMETVYKTWGGDEPWMGRDRFINDMANMISNAPYGLVTALLARVQGTD